MTTTPAIDGWFTSGLRPALVGSRCDACATVFFPRLEDVLGSAVVADPLHLLDICATSDGGAALVLTSMDYARSHGTVSPVRVRAVSTVTPTFPQTVIEMPNFATDSPATVPAGERTFKESIAHAAYEEAGIGPEDVDVAEVYDLDFAHPKFL